MAWRSWPNAKGTYRKIVQNPKNTVDGRIPAPVDRWFIPLFMGFQPSFWWCRISSIHRRGLEHLTVNQRVEFSSALAVQVLCLCVSLKAYVSLLDALAWRNDDAQLFGHLCNDLSKCIRKIQRVLFVLFVKESLLHNLLSFTSRAVSTATSRTFLWSTPRQKIANPNSYPNSKELMKVDSHPLDQKKRPSLNQTKTHGQPLGHVYPQHLGQVADVDKMLMYSTAPAEEISSPRLLATQGIAWRETLQATKENNGRYMLIYIYIYITLHYITLHYITLHYISLCTLNYITLHYIALHYITLHYITLHTYILYIYIYTYIYIYIYIYTYKYNIYIYTVYKHVLAQTDLQITGFSNHVLICFHWKFDIPTFRIHRLIGYFWLWVETLLPCFFSNRW